MKNLMKNRLILALSILVLALIGCSKFEIDNPFYEKNGLWEDPFHLTAMLEEGDSSKIRLDWNRPEIVPSVSFDERYCSF